MTQTTIDGVPIHGAPGGLYTNHGLTTSTPNALRALGNGLTTEGANTRRFSDRASIILVGVRGAGKRSLGFIGAAYLGRRFITEGHYFQEVTGSSRGEYLQKHGKSDYYRCSRDVFRKMLYQNEWNCVIECGMASLDRGAQELLKRFSQTHPVVYVVRDFEQISRLLKLSEDDVRRLQQWDSTHRQFSNLEFYNLYDSTGNNIDDNDHTENLQLGSSYVLRDIKVEFSKFVDAVYGKAHANSKTQSPFALDAIRPEQRQHTYSAIINLSHVLDDQVNLEAIEMGEDAVRLRADIQHPELRAKIGECIAQLRRRVGVPIILDVDMNMFRNYGKTMKAYFEMLEQGLRLGVDYLVVDLEHGDNSLSGIISRKGHTKILGSYFDTVDLPRRWLSEDRMIQYRRAQSLGCDIIELSQKAHSRQDNDDIRIFQSRVQSTAQPYIPLICYNVGIYGRQSLITNRTLTPVRSNCTPEMVHGSDVPLITSAEATIALFANFTLDRLRFFVAGNLAAHSLSPAMHNAAYKHLGMTHEYSNHEASGFKQLRDLLEDPYFGGCSVNTPFKVVAYEQLVHKSPHAVAIGAVNTLLPLRRDPDGNILMPFKQAAERNRAGPIAGFYGDNTDWIGLTTAFRRRLSPRNAISPMTTGLVLGAGGAARAAIYGLLYLGCQNIYIWNRTEDAAVAVAEHFNIWARTNDSASKDVAHVIPSTQPAWPVGLSFPTMIISCIPGMVAGSDMPTKVTIPPDWLASPSGGVVADVSYKPVDTALLRQVHECRKETGRPWVTVNGLELLPLQGVAQFELMTGRRAPRRLMRETVLQNYGRT